MLPPRRLQLTGRWSVSIGHIAGNQQFSEAPGERVEQRHLGLLVKLRPLKKTHDLTALLSSFIMVALWRWASRCVQKHSWNKQESDISVNLDIVCKELLF